MFVRGLKGYGRLVPVGPWRELCGGEGDNFKGACQVVTGALEEDGLQVQEDLSRAPGLLHQRAHTGPGRRGEHR